MTRQTKFIRGDTLEKRYPLYIEQNPQNEKRETILLLQENNKNKDETKEETKTKPMVSFSQLVSSFYSTGRTLTNRVNNHTALFHLE